MVSPSLGRRLIFALFYIVLPSIINAGIFTSALSASSSFMFTASRILYGLGLRGLAPGWVSHCTKSGVPIAALAVCVRRCFSGASEESNGLYLVLFSFAGVYGCEERIFESLRVSILTNGYQFTTGFSHESYQMKQLVYQYRDSGNVHWVVDHQLDFPSLL